MNCPVCNRNNAVTLSICPSCGAMIDDSVREELKDKISPIIKPLALERKPFAPRKFEMQSVSSNSGALVGIPKPDKPLAAPTIEKTGTMELSVKTTVPTLVAFHTDAATVPEWRLQLQNAVQQRQSRFSSESADMSNGSQTKLVTNGATALKTETVIEPQRILHKNPTVNSALQRIEQSRRQFLIEETPEIVEEVIAEPAAKSYPFRIATKGGETLPAPIEARPAQMNFTVKPKSVTLKTTEKEFDTNKLPKISAKISSRFEKDAAETELKLAETQDVVDEEIETEEIEDLAPFAMRFNAGLFDLIIGAFVSLLLLTPFMIKSESWFTYSGLIAFAVTCAVVMFIYLTTAVALYGRTFGMRLFSLEVVDIEGEEYPTIHQAAVSSCVYLLSLALGGVGFLTLPFSAEKRAVHDLVSGTIVVREV